MTASTRTRFPEALLSNTALADGLTIWDAPGDPIGEGGRVLTWNGYTETEAYGSLLRYVDANGDRLRKTYLAWIHDLGEYRVKGKRIIDHLALDNGLSYWWMTRFAEKSPWKSQSITDAIRLFALEEIVDRHRPSGLRLVTANERLHEVIAGFCRNRDIPYMRHHAPAIGKSGLSRSAVRRALPHSAKALLAIVRYVIGRWSLRRARPSSWFSGHKQLFFCSYFFNLDHTALHEGRFRTYYWDALHDLLRDEGFSANWLHLYIAHAAVPAPNVAVEMARTFSSRDRTEGRHAFVDSYLSLAVVARAMFRWLKLRATAEKLGEIEGAFRPAGSHLSFWPLMSGEWRDSLWGESAVRNLLWIGLFDSAVAHVPHQSKGIYLCENQCWERALVHAWRTHGHGQLIAVAHGPIRFWDLRYFSDGRTTHSARRYPIPCPNLVVLNGEAALDAYRGTDLSPAPVAEGEALRYTYLNGLPSKNGERALKGGPKIVLILGDYVESSTERLLNLLGDAASNLGEHLAYTLKPHPGSPVRAEDYPRLKLTVTNVPLLELLPNFDIAYAANLTSAAVDAYLAGLMVIVMLDEGRLNLSPLKGRAGVSFVSNSDELAQALKSGRDAQRPPVKADDFFYLDPGLPRWRALLSVSKS